MSDDPDLDTTRREKVDAVSQVAGYNPKLVVFLVVVGLAAAVLEGVGLTFLLPIIEIIQSDTPQRRPTGWSACSSRHTSSSESRSRSSLSSRASLL